MIGEKINDLEVWGQIETIQISIIKIDLNTEKSPGVIRKLALTRTLVRKHPLKLVAKTLKRLYNDNNENNTARWKNNKKKAKEIKMKEMTLKSLLILISCSSVRIKYKSVKKNDNYIDISSGKQV